MYLILTLLLDNKCFQMTSRPSVRLDFRVWTVQFIHTKWSIHYQCLVNCHFNRDKSIPELDAMFLDDPSGELSELSQLLEKQVLLEKEDGSATQTMDPENECAPPPPCHEFQTARLFLSHFGLLSKLDSNQVHNHTNISNVILNISGSWCTAC